MTPALEPHWTAERSDFAAPAGDVQEASLFSPVLGRDWPYQTYRPPGDTHASLPLLYLLHGRQADHTTWTGEGGLAALLDAEILAGHLPPLRAIMPAAGDSWYVNGHRDDGAEPLEQAFFSDFLPQIEARFSPPLDRPRLVAGYSMGGYGALRYLLVRPDLFGAALLLSPAIYDRLPPAESAIPTLSAFGRPFDAARWTAMNYPAQLRALPAPTSVFIAAGDADRPHTDEHCNVEVQSALLHARLRGLGVNSHLRILPGGHDWDVWRPGLVAGLRILTAKWTA